MNNPTEKKIRRITPQFFTPMDYKRFNLLHKMIKPQTKPIITYSLKKYYPVDSILDYRKTNNIEEYLIKWEGYDQSYNSWEPKKNLKCPELLKQFEEKMKINQNKNDEKFLNKKRHLIKKNTNQIRESNKENVDFLKEEEIKNKIMTLNSFLNLL
jgi:hypothetical protein